MATAEEPALLEAERLLDQAGNSADEDVAEALTERAYCLLQPLLLREIPGALYLHACCTLSREELTGDEHERRFIDLVRRAAEAGHAKAQFTLGQLYEDEALGPDPAMSATWFAKSAAQGYAYAEWVHGLNLLQGVGLPRDEVLGLAFIRRAAEGKFEGAIQFIVDACENGTHGHARDPNAATAWREKLNDPGLISY
jgi:TPR repeat protein